MIGFLIGLGLLPLLVLVNYVVLALCKFFPKHILSMIPVMIGLDTIGEVNMADDAIGQDQLKSVVTLQIIDSGGTVVKTMFAAGA